MRATWTRPCTRGVEQQGAVEVAAGREERDRHGHRLEEAEQRPQGVLENERVVLASAGCGEQDQFVSQGVLVDERPVSIPFASGLHTSVPIP